MRNEIAEAFEATVEQSHRHVGTRILLWLVAFAGTYLALRVLFS